MKWIKGAVLFFLLMQIVACEQNPSSRLAAKPTAFGPISQIAVIADSEDWEILKDTFEFYFETPYPLLPQPEPIFDTRHFTPTDLITNTARRRLRTYIILADQLDTSSQTLSIIEKDLESYSNYHGDNNYTIKMARDKWAKNQLLIYIYGKSRESVQQAIIDRFNQIAGQIRKFEKEALDKQVYIGGENKQLAAMIQDSFGVSLRIPKEAQLAKINNEHAWIRIETKKTSSSLLFSRKPYLDQSQATKKGLKEWRNQLTKRFIQGDQVGSYMIINDEDLPVLYQKTSLNGATTYEIRGIWEMEGAFMGGPFASYGIIGPNLESLYFIDAFVYAPGEDKRDLMQELEHIVSTTHILSE